MRLASLAQTRPAFGLNELRCGDEIRLEKKHKVAFRRGERKVDGIGVID